MEKQCDLIHASDWDILIILDACRPDVFEQIYPKYFNGSYQRVESAGCPTWVWVKNTFPDNYSDIVYLSANPYISSMKFRDTPANREAGLIGHYYAEEHFYKIEPLFLDGWESIEGIETVPPWNVIKEIWKWISSGKRIIAHFIQPHSPYIGETKLDFLPVKPARDELLGKPFDESDVIKIVEKKFLRQAYRDNLILVLNEIKEFTRRISDIKIVITSDHGEMLGEDDLVGHYKNVPELRVVPWLEIEPNKPLATVNPRIEWINGNCSEGERILDVGSASGFVFRGTPHETYVTKVDLDLYRMPGFIQMDAHHLAFRDKCFDVVVLGDIVEHVEDPVQVLREAKRTANRILATVPDEANWAPQNHPYSSVEDLMRYEGCRSVEHLAREAGPEVVQFCEGYEHCFHKRFYSEQSLRNDLKEAGIGSYEFDRLQYSGWSFFTVKVPGSVEMDKFMDKTTEELEAEFDREYFCWDGKGEAKGYKGLYADSPENRKFLAYIKTLNPESVLEVGCAYGFLVKRLNDAGIPTKGVDVSTFAYKMRATDDLQVASVLDLPFEDDEFDLVVTIELLEHIREEDTPKALSELARVSRRGAHWIAYKEVDDLFQTKDKTHINIRPYQEWVELFAKICGPNHKVVYKERDWYPHEVETICSGEKTGLNVGSFTSMLSCTESTKWQNIDILDLKGYADAYGYIFHQFDARTLTPYQTKSVDYIVASHFLEHLTADEGLVFLKECHRVLKREGIIRLAVPDAELLSRKYAADELGYFDEINIECEKSVTPLGKLNALLWGGHKTVYDAPTLSYALQKAGFKPILQSFNKSSRPDLMNQMFDYHPDLSLYMEGAPIKEEKPVTVGPRKEDLKIAVLSTPFLKSPPDHYGGLEIVTTNLAAGLAELGQDVTLFAARGSKPVGDYEVFETIDPVFDFGTDWGKIDWYEKEKAHYETFKDRLKEYDIVHGHGWFAFEYMAKRDGLASHVCHTHHGGLGFKTKPCEKMNLIAISKFMAESYARQLNTHVHFVYNGIDLDAYPYKAVKGDRLIFVGRFVSFKQPHVAIQVAKKLGMGLDLIGGAYEEPYFSQQVKPHCDGEQIVLHTEAPHELKVRLLQDAKALIFSSAMKEPFGLVLVEANSCGTPVIGSRDGAIPELLHDGVNGFVCDSVDEMVEAVRKIDTIKPENCRKIVEQNFSRAIMSQRYLELFRMVVSGEEW